MKSNFIKRTEAICFFLYIFCIFISGISYGQVTCAVTQTNTSNVSANTNNNEVIGITVTTVLSGTVTDFSLTTIGTTNASGDISNAKIWYTGTTNSFATTSQFGTTLSAPNGSFTITGSQALAAATINYFWLTYDVTTGANVCGSVIDAECNAVTVSASSYTPSPTNPAGSRAIATAMYYSSGTTTQNNTTKVTPSITNNEVICIKIVTNGNLSSLNATDFILNTIGTTNAAADISNAKLWYTGTSSTFAITTQFGSNLAAPNGTFTITGTQSLIGCATNYFWLSYDVTAGATINNVIDAQCISLIVGSTTYTPLVTSPAGSRTILPLDPPIARNWGTYYGGSLAEEARSCAVDGSGNIYIAGGTASTTGIATAGAHQTTHGSGTNDAFLVKFNSAGVRLWGTYYGGNADDYGLYCATDVSGNVYLSGYTSTTTTTVIATTGAHQTASGGGIDGFLVKFNSAGVRQWGTYYGVASIDRAVYISPEGIGNIYLSGYTTGASSSLATAGAHQTTAGGLADGFLVKFNSAGVRVWGTYYGGASDDYGTICAVDASGNDVYMVGQTVSTTAIATGGAHQVTYGGGTFDGFLVKFNNAGGRAWGTYYGGSGNDIGYSVDVDSSGNDVYMVGETTSATAIATAGAYQTAYGGGTKDGFLVKFNSAGGQTWGTYYGGTGADIGYSIVVDGSSNDIYLAGQTASATAIATSYTGIHQATYGGGANDAFLGKFNNAGVRQWVTYYGGTGTENGYSCAADGNGNVYLAGSTASTNTVAISTSGAHQEVKGSGATNDAFLVRFVGLPSALSTSVSFTDVSCNGGNDGSATVSVTGGTPSYTYLWNNSQTTSTATGLSAGNYTVTITDGNNSIISATVSVSAPAAISTTVTSTPATCNGGNDGTASVSVSGGTSSYTYNWNVGQGASTATGLGTGNYTVNITDGNGCTASATVNVNQSVILSTTVSSTAVSCNGGNDGSATVNAGGGSPSYIYNWNIGQSDSTATGLSAGNYTVMITDGNGCTASVTINVSEPTAISTTVSPTDITCNGANDGTASASVAGGSPGYTYSWNTSPPQTMQTATGLPPGNYTVTITDANGCMDTQTVSIGEPTVLTSSVSATDISCNGANDGSASANVNGGIYPYTYAWNSSPFQTAQTATGLSVGNYTVAITDANGCTDTQTVSISEPAILTASISVTTNVSCNGGNNGSASANAGGGTLPYTYFWSSSPPQTTQTATGLSRAIYMVTITDNNGCTATQTVSVSEPAVLSASVSSTEATCSAANDGSASVSAGGGTIPYTYLWSNGATASAASALGSGSYTVTITDVNGCTKTQTVTVAVSTTGITPFVSADTAIILGDSAQLSSSGGVVYFWSPPAGLSNPNISNPVATPSATTEYCVTVTDTSGCAGSACVKVSVDIVCGTVYIPNAFSPNGDNENEEECVYGNCISTMNFVIYNRWGEKIFETSDRKMCWDGKYLGRLQNTGVYTYYLEGKSITGEAISRKGNISLIR